jgi:hypothetical protein
VVDGATDVDDAATVDAVTAASAPDSPELHDDRAITAAVATTSRRRIREGRVGRARIGVEE